MRKGFLLGGPVTKKPAETKKEEDKKETTKDAAAAPVTPAQTGAVPRATNTSAIVTAGKRRRRTRSLGASLSPSPGRGFYVPGHQGSSPSAMTLQELMDASKGAAGL